MPLNLLKRASRSFCLDCAKNMSVYSIVILTCYIIWLNQSQVFKTTHAEKHESFRICEEL